MKRLILAWLLLLALPAQAEHAFVGAGISSCATIAEGYAADLYTMRYVLVAWGQGYLSGFNAALIDEYNSIMDLDGIQDDLFNAIRIYCTANPMGMPLDAIDAFITTLPVYRLDENGNPIR